MQLADYLTNVSRETALNRFLFKSLIDKLGELKVIDKAEFDTYMVGELRKTFQLTGEIKVTYYKQPREEVKDDTV